MTVRTARTARAPVQGNVPGEEVADVLFWGVGLWGVDKWGGDFETGEWGTSAWGRMLWGA